jgi:DNA mismatch repair protein MutS
MIYDEYASYTEKYKASYGSNVVVLMEVGSFFELYGVNNENEVSGADVSTVCDLLNIQMTKKDKSVQGNSRSNPLTAGFPSHVLRKFIDILVNNSYTVVLVEQTTPPPRPRREVTAVISPSTYLESTTTTTTYDRNLLMVIFVSSASDWKTRTERLTISCAMFDVSTGVAYGYDCPTSELKDNQLLLEDAYRVLVTYKPKEVVVFDDTSATPLYNEIRKSLQAYQAMTNACVHDKLGEPLTQPVTKKTYQDEILRRVYPSTGMLSPSEFLDLEYKQNLQTAYVYLLNFVYEHNPNYIKNVKKIDFIETENRLILVNNCIENLNVVSGSSSKSSPMSLLSLLNSCQTSMGKRLFKERILSPLVSPDEIQKRYLLVEGFLDTYKDYSSILSEIYDLERYFRKVDLQMLQPAEFPFIDTSVLAVDKILRQLDPIALENLGWTPQLSETLASWTKSYRSTFNLSEISKYNLNTIAGSFFQPGIYEEIDTADQAYNKSLDFFTGLTKNLNELGGSMGVEFKLDCSNEREDYNLQVTKKRWDTFLAQVDKTKLKNVLSSYGIDTFEAKPISTSNKTNLRLSHPIFHSKNEAIHQAKSDLKELVSKRYLSTLGEFSQLYGTTLFRAIVDFVSKMDVAVASAKNARKYNYTKPVITEKESSFVKAKKLRHPLIEIIQQETAYIPNDLSFENETGMLLYGINAVGKSSFMKSVGLNVILAQAGHFVASESFEYYPYKHIFTRIPGGDNIHKGQSTFAVEMSELRNILKRANRWSLVIGDELCSGTESISAISIVTAGILTLASRGTSFIFASHLHEISELQCITELNNVGVYHMGVRFDDRLGTLIYERTIQPGSGETLYGLEVCKSLDLDSEFLSLANSIRMKTLGQNKAIVDATKKSRYNASVFVDTCDICKRTATEVHHIQQQKDANDNGFFEENGQHKNSRWNLLRVCETCHDTIHHDGLKLGGYMQTLDGVKLITSENPTTTTEKTDLGAVANLVRELKGKKVSIQGIIEKVGEQMNVKLTRYQIGKIVREA